MSLHIFRDYLHGIMVKFFASTPSPSSNHRIFGTTLSISGMSAPASVAVPAEKTKAAKPKVLASHPPVIDMVKAAIMVAKDRKGTSRPTIKNYIAANYKVDVEKLGPHIWRGIVHVVEKNSLVRVGNKSEDASGATRLRSRR
ncbi:histone H1/5 [Paragonimus westermani]|uniref:Histone H1/5 n=1 Tax=Paragonimus westermani TaxID=34504 RepID=A0A5J4N707_9TREM|nr:histone H1/5 [Paragonimus westermani]